MKIIQITDKDIRELEALQPFTSLSEAQLLHYDEPNGGIFIAESPRVILRALDFGAGILSILAEESQLTSEDAKAILSRCPELTLYTGSKETLSQIRGYQMTRGMLACMKRPAPASPWELIRDKKRIVILEDVENPTNVGTIFRNAAALGMEAVLLSPGSADPLYRRAARVSMGTVFQIPFAYLPVEKDQESWSTAGIPALHDLGFQTVAMALRNDSVAITDPVLHEAERLAILMGNESNGLTDHTMVQMDYTVTIPMSHGVDSLNVAAASAVAFWELGNKTLS